jgi:hypothetical protein
MSSIIYILYKILVIRPGCQNEKERVASESFLLRIRLMLYNDHCDPDGNRIEITAG